MLLNLFSHLRSTNLTCQPISCGRVLTVLPRNIRIYVTGTYATIAMMVTMLNGLHHILIL